MAFLFLDNRDITFFDRRPGETGTIFLTLFVYLLFVHFQITSQCWKSFCAVSLTFLTLQNIPAEIAPRLFADLHLQNVTLLWLNEKLVLCSFWENIL